MLSSIQLTFEFYNTSQNSEIFKDLNLIFADVKLIKLKYDNLSFDISINNFTGLTKLIFMKYAENKFSEKFPDNPNLFKRTLIFIKAWCYYEGCILGSNISLMANYALEVLVIYVFNNFSHLFNTELDAFFTFVKIISEFDWKNHILHIFGSTSCDEYLEKTKFCEDPELGSLWFIKEEKMSQDYLLPKSEILQLIKDFEKFTEIDKIQNFSMYKKSMALKYLNIIDPVFNNNNLGKSINLHNFTKIKKVFEFLNQDVNNVIHSRSTSNPIKHINFSLKLFSKSTTANYPELLYFSLPFPKIIINPYLNIQDESVSKNIRNKISNVSNNSFSQDKTFMLNDSEKQHNISHSNANENFIYTFNKIFSKTNGHVINLNIFKDIFEESKFSSNLSTGYQTSVYYTKEILDILIKKFEEEEINIGNTKIKYKFNLYYDSTYLEEFLRNLKI
jgi:hypothetical protein